MLLGKLGKNDGQQQVVIRGDNDTEFLAANT